MLLSNIFGTLSSAFSLGKGSNKASIRTNSGVLQGQNNGGSWTNLIGAGGVWGSITGTLSNQTDLSTVLNGKQASLGYTPLNPSSNLSDVGDANTSLNNILPSQTSQGNKFLTTNGTSSSWAVPSVAYIVASVNNSDYTITTATFLVVTTGSSTRTITLPQASTSQGKEIIVKKADSGSGSVTIDGYSSETLDGSLTKTISGQYTCIRLICDGSNWHIVPTGMWS